MRLLALERETGATHPIDPARAREVLVREARRVWELEQADVIREAFFRADRDEAILVLEADGVEEARRILASLPLVAAGTIEFELIPLRPYPGLARLFAESPEPE